MRQLNVVVLNFILEVIKRADEDSVAVFEQLPGRKASGARGGGNGHRVSWGLLLHVHKTLHASLVEGIFIVYVLGVQEIGRPGLCLLASEIGLPLRLLLELELVVACGLELPQIIEAVLNQL